MPTKTQITAMAMDLEDGQSWDDEVTFTTSRQDMHIILASLSVMLRNIHEGLQDAEDSARRGDVLAMLAGPHLYQSAKQLQGVTRELTAILLPALYAEVEANDAAEAAEEAATKAN